MLRLWVTAITLLSSASALAQVDVTGAWARAAVEGQMGTGAFMTLKAREPMKLLGVASSVADVVEIHEMALQGSVMRMRAVETLDLPAGVAVELKPGGYHVMLMDLKQPLKVGDRITLELRLQTADGRRLTQPLQVEVRRVAPNTP